MSRQLVIHDWCDVCQRDDGAQVEALSYTMQLDGRPRTLELCDMHQAQYVKPLADLLADLGRKPDDGEAPRKGAGRPRKGLEAPGAQAEPTGQQRARKAPPEAQEATPQDDEGYPCIICGTHLARADNYRRHLASVHDLPPGVLQGDTCPVCGQGGLTRMGVHVAGQHGDMGLGNSAQALVWARENGDPYGAYRAVMKAAGKALA